MALDISREIASVRNSPLQGNNWIARALQKIQDAANAAPVPAAAAPSATTTIISSAAGAVQQISGVQNGQITQQSIGPGSVTAAALAGGAVTATAIAADAVTAPAIANGAVGTVALAAGAVSAIQTQLQASVALTTSLAEVATVTLSTAGGNVLISASAQMNNAGGSQEVIEIQVWKGTNAGSLLLDTGAAGLPVAAGGALPWACAPLVDASPAASQQYTIYASIAAGTGTLANLLLTAVNLKA